MIEALTSIRALSEEVRIRLLFLLRDRKACVCELMEVFDMAQSKLSHHLITLRDAGLLQDERRGKWNYYTMRTGSLSPVNRELTVALHRLYIDEPALRRDRERLASVQKKLQICC